MATYVPSWEKRVSAPVEQAPVTDPLAPPSDQYTDATQYDADGNPIVVVRPQGTVLPPPSKTATAFDGLLQGATGNFSDEVTDPLGALIATAMQDPGALVSGNTQNPALAEALANAPADTQSKLKAEAATNPTTAFLSSLGGIGLGTVAGGALAKGIPVLGPKLATTIGNAAKAFPKLSAGIAGGVGNDLFTIGQGQGDLANRLPDPIISTGIGVGGGVAGNVLLRGASRIAGPTIKRGVGKVQSFSQDLADLLAPPQTALAQTHPAVGPTGPLQPPTAALPPPNSLYDAQAAAALQAGKTIPMTTGDRLQNPVQQGIEDQALRQGDPSMVKARSIQQDALYAPFEKATGQKAVAIGTPEDMANNGATDIAGASRAAQIAREQYDSLGAQVNAAYKAADQAGEGVSISADSIINEFLDPVTEEMAVRGYRPGDIPNLDKKLDEIEQLLAPDKDGFYKLDSAKLKSLEDWKKRVNQTKFSSEELSDSAVGGYKQLLSNGYDKFLTNLADDSIINGDETAIKAFKEARGLASKKFKFYDSDKVIQKMLDTRDLSGKQLANIIYGTGDVTGKGDNGRIAETMIRLAGDRGPEMQTALKQGVMARILERSQSKTLDPVMSEKGIDRATLSPAKLLNNLNELINKNPEMFGAVFESNEQDFLKQFTKEVRQLSSRQPGAVNNSNTWTMIAKYLNHVPGVGHTPWGIGMQKLATMHVEHSIRGKAAAGLEEMIPKVINNMDAPSAYYGYIGGAIPTEFNTEEQD